MDQTLVLFSFFHSALFLQRKRLSKIFLHKVHVLYLEGPAVQVLQRPGIRGKAKGKLVGIERLAMTAVLSVVPLIAILPIPHQRVAGSGKLGPDLVGAPGNEVTLHQRQAVFHCKGLIHCNSGLGSGLGAGTDIDLLFHFVFKNIALQLSRWGLHFALDHTEIILVELPVLDLLVHDPQTFGGLSGDDNAPSVAVNAVTQGGGKGIFPVGGPFLLLIEIGLNVDDKGGDMLQNNFKLVVNKNNVWVGPGHNSILIKDDEGTEWMVYHGYKVDAINDGRVVLLDRLRWDENGWPYIKGLEPSNSDLVPVFK